MKRRIWIRLVAIAAIACAATVFAAETTTPPATAPTVKGNPDTKVYHKPACRHYAAKGTTAEFKSEEEAVKAGYKPCKQCAAPKKDDKKPKEDEQKDGEETPPAEDAE